MKKIVLFSIAVLFLVSVCLWNIKNDRKNNMENEEKEEIDRNNKEAFFVAGMIASYTYIDRKLSVSDFDNIGLGDEWDIIIEKMGEPNGIAGSGFQIPYYELSDGTFMCFVFDLYQERDGKGELIRDNNGKLNPPLKEFVNMYLADRNGKLEDLLGQ